MTTSLLLADSRGGTQDEQLSFRSWNRSVSRKWIQREFKEIKWNFISRAVSSRELNVLRLEEVVSASLPGHPSESGSQPGVSGVCALAGGESTDSGRSSSASISLSPAADTEPLATLLEAVLPFDVY